MLAERYRVVGPLGRGGMGEVWRADDLKLRQAVALKFLPEKLSRDAEMLARFHREVRTARRVSHPNVCRVFDIGETGGSHFLSMEYIDGEDLSSLLRRIGRLPEDKAVEVARQICAGLAAAHDEGVLHRDLKPANVMIDGRGRARITDFGLAGLADEITGRDISSGTPAYMAPEQLTGKEVSARSDIYSLGLLPTKSSRAKAFYALRSTNSAAARETSRRRAFHPFIRTLPRVELVSSGVSNRPAKRPASALTSRGGAAGRRPLAAALRPRDAFAGMAPPRRGGRAQAVGAVAFFGSVLVMFARPPYRRRTELYRFCRWSSGRRLPNERGDRRAFGRVRRPRRAYGFGRDPKALDTRS